MTDQGSRRLTPAEAIEILQSLVSGGPAGLEGGAELEVFDEAGQSVLLAPLARHARLDEDRIIWVRPIVSGFSPQVQGEPGYVFDLHEARRRALDALAIRTDGSELVLELRSKERARVRAATGRTKSDLDLWDRFYYSVLDAHDQIELDALEADS